MTLTKQHFTIFLILITEVLGFSLILPFIPFMAKEMGASPFVIGLLLTTFSFFQFISAPIAGTLSDRFGRKPLLLICQVATLASFLILGFANSLWMLFLSRIIDGLLGSNATIAKAYLSDITSQKDKSKVFAVSGAAFGFGFMIGPIIGGTLAQTSYALPSFIASGIALISIILTIFTLPETIKKQTTVFKLGTIKLIDYERIKFYLTNKKVNQQLIEFGCYAFAMALFSGSFSVYADIKYSATTQQIGLVLTTIGLTNVIFRGLLIPKLIDRFGERRLERVGVSLMIISLLLSLFSTSFVWQYPAIILFASGAGLNYPLMMGDISRSVNENEQGAIIGVANSLDSLANIAGPFIGGLLLASSYPDSFLLMSMGTMVFCLILILREKKNY